MGQRCIVTITDVYYAKALIHNILSYGSLDLKGHTPTSRGAQHVVTSSDEKNVIIGVELARNVLIVRVNIRKNCSRSRNVIMVAMGKNGVLRNTFRQRRKGSLIYFHRRLRHINYKAIERLQRILHRQLY